VPAHPKKPNLRQSALLLSAVAMIAMALPSSAFAGNFFEMLFGGFGGGRASVPSSVQAYADPSVADGTGERLVSQGGGPSATYCVRLCDGQHFPVPRNSSLSPAQACNSFCPASKTKVFSGSGIDHASANDGTRYADLDNAFVYRKQVVPGCTCNGQTPGGLATMDVNEDPTLRPGDIVATNTGFVAFKGAKKGTAEFTPLPPDAQRKLAEVKVVPASGRPAVQATTSPSDISASARDDNRRAQLR
jgi:hypothetical protein